LLVVVVVVVSRRRRDGIPLRLDAFADRVAPRRRRVGRVEHRDAAIPQPRQGLVEDRHRQRLALLGGLVVLVVEERRFRVRRAPQTRVGGLARRRRGLGRLARHARPRRLGVVVLLGVAHLAPVRADVEDARARPAPRQKREQFGREIRPT